MSDFEFPVECFPRGDENYYFKGFFLKGLGVFYPWSFEESGSNDEGREVNNDVILCKLRKTEMKLPRLIHFLFLLNLNYGCRK